MKIHILGFPLTHVQGIQDDRVHDTVFIDQLEAVAAHAEASTNTKETKFHLNSMVCFHFGPESSELSENSIQTWLR